MDTSLSDPLTRKGKRSSDSVQGHFSYSAAVPNLTTGDQASFERGEREGVLLTPKADIAICRQGLVTAGEHMIVAQFSEHNNLRIRPVCHQA